ncbi:MULTISPECIES: WPE palindromic element domain-containing protein [unclassified Wolbachia]|nr:WPE palindromic element domain-containing protein [Wolbachia endosymbiont (group A) of Apoderus coryli]
MESRKKNGVIPVPRHWDPENLTLPSKCTINGVNLRENISDCV